MKYNIININKCEVDIDFSVQDNLKTFKEEVLDHFYLTCKNKDVCVIFSGGNDSRFIARSLVELGIKFYAITYVHKSDYSDYDTLVSTEFCKKWGIKHEPRYLHEPSFYKKVLNLANNGIVYVIQNSYFMHHTMEQEFLENKFNGIFLSGAGSEFKIIDGKMPIPHNNEYIKEHNPDKWFNFTTDRTLLSYVRNPIFLKEWRNTTQNGFDVRDMIYRDSYRDTEFIQKTRGPNHHIEEWFWKNLPQISFNNHARFCTEVYQWDFQQYLKSVNLYEPPTD